MTNNELLGACPKSEASNIVIKVSTSDELKDLKDKLKIVDDVITDKNTLLTTLKEKCDENVKVIVPNLMEVYKKKCSKESVFSEGLGKIHQLAVELDTTDNTSIISNLTDSAKSFENIASEIKESPLSVF